MELTWQIRAIYWTKYSAYILFFYSRSLLLLSHFYLLLSFFLPATSIKSSMYAIMCACVCVCVCVCVCRCEQVRARKFS